LGTHNCQSCGAIVPRGQICSRCGAPQPRALRRVLILTASGLFALLMVAFVSLEGGGAEVRAEPPSNTDDDESVRGEGEPIGPSLITEILNSDAAVP